MVGPNQARPLDEYEVESTLERRIDATRALVRCGQVLEKARQPAHQRIFHLRYAKNHSIRSIAEKVGKSNDAVKVSLRRSRTALAEGVPELDGVLDNMARSA